MSDLRKAAQQALEALESSRVFVTSREKTKHPEGTEWYDERVDTLRAALAQPEPELAIGQIEEHNRAMGVLAQPEIKPPKHQQAIATVLHEGDGRQQIEFITQLPVGELVRLYADPPLYHVDLMNVAVSVRNACHNAWVTSMENWRADIDLKEIVSSIATQHKDVGKPAAYAVHQITDDDGVEAWEDIFTSPDIATDTARRLSKTDGAFEAVPLYRSTGVTAPPQRKPLTEGEIDEIIYSMAESDRANDRFTFARAIEAAHGIGVMYE